MKRIIGAFSTVVQLDNEEVRSICKLGQGQKCCAFLVMGSGFECVRMDPSISRTIFNRLENNSINARGEGGWEGCAWPKVDELLRKRKMNE